MKLLHFLLLGVLAVNATAKWTNTEIANSVEKWTKVGIEAGHVGTDPGISTAMSVIDALGSAIPYAGPLASLISGIMGFFVKSDTAIIKEKLNEMNQQLKHIDEHLDEVLHQIVAAVTDTAIKSEYQKQVDKMLAISAIYDRFMGNPTNVTRNDFRDSCRQVKMLTFANWIQNGLTGNSLLPLRRLIVKDYDIGNLNTWSYRITQALSKAVFLHITCVGMAEESEETIMSTLNGNSAGGKGDIALFQDIFRNVIRSFNEARKEIKRNHFQRAKAEAKAYLDSHTSASHRDFVDQLSAQLRRNYPERTWFVAAWDAGAQGYRQHAYYFNDQNVWVWRESSRNLWVASILPPRRSRISDEIEECIRKAKQRDVFSKHLQSREVYDDIYPCIKTPFAGLAVIKFGNTLRGTYGTDSYGFFTNVFFGPGDSQNVSIMAVLLDPTFSTTREICEMTDDINYTTAPTGYHCCPKNPKRHCADDKICPGCYYTERINPRKIIFSRNFFKKLVENLLKKP